MGIRRIRRQQRQVDMAESRRVNGHVKEKERARRDARLMEALRTGKLPFIPAVMSWLSVKLDKPSSKIVQADIDALLAAQA
ncbi:MAG: hypothetical protein K2W96_13655 [Gemmataceae bacterium]|nr:hypothetical protein [Gemmataceae bacterium]